MPSIGFIARLAIPVLKDIEVMSRIAVPVVSDPVPAVVGTVRPHKPSHSKSQNVLVRTCNERAQLFRNRKTFAHGRVDEVEEVRILVHRKSMVGEVGFK